MNDKMPDDAETFARVKPSDRPAVEIFGRRLPMPRSRLWRIVLGIFLVIGGCLGFLPILGFWMLPLGILVLSYEFAMIRRFRRRTAVWWGRRGSKAGQSNL